MTAFEAIKKALAAFDYPVVPDRYEGEKDHYFTYNYADDHGSDYGDDEPGCIVTGVQVHFYLPMDEDFLAIRNQIREALFAEGFTYPSVMIITDHDMIEALKDADRTVRRMSGIRQILFECEYTEDR